MKGSHLLSFCAGAVAGALLVFYLEESRRDAPDLAAAARAGATSERPLSSEPVGVPSPVGAGIEPPVRDARPPTPAVAPAAPLGGDALAIPVAGVAPGALHDHFDDPRGGRVHHAIDIAAPRGTAVLAVADGTIAKLFLSRAGGITIYQFDPKEQWIYYYAHLEGYAPQLAEGKTVKRGEVIGFVGTSGNAPPNVPHLHFAVEKLPPTKEWWKGEAVNPYPMLARRGVTYTARR